MDTEALESSKPQTGRLWRNKYKPHDAQNKPSARGCPRAADWGQRGPQQGLGLGELVLFFYISFAFHKGKVFPRAAHHKEIQPEERWSPPCSSASSAVGTEPRGRNPTALLPGAPEGHPDHHRPARHRHPDAPTTACHHLLPSSPLHYLPPTHRSLKKQNTLSYTTTGEVVLQRRRLINPPFSITYGLPASKQSPASQTLSKSR